MYRPKFLCPVVQGLFCLSLGIVMPFLIVSSLKSEENQIPNYPNTKFLQVIDNKLDLVIAQANQETRLAYLFSLSNLNSTKIIGKENFISNQIDERFKILNNLGTSLQSNSNLITPPLFSTDFFLNLTINEGNRGNNNSEKFDCSYYLEQMKDIGLKSQQIELIKKKSQYPICSQESKYYLSLVLNKLVE
jgi:hypothetical protein